MPGVQRCRKARQSRRRPGETSASPSAAWQTTSPPGGCCGKTSPESYLRRIMRLDASWQLFAELTPPSSLQGEDGSTPIAVWWPDPKEPWRGGCLTPNGTEFPNDENVCLSWLWQVLETGPVPTRFYLSANACRGILRRAERRGKKLPEMLEAALRARIGMEDESPHLVRPQVRSRHERPGDFQAAGGVPGA